MEDSNLLCRGEVHTPGKVIITGEHSVVYGKPALVMAINLTTKAKYQAQEILNGKDLFQITIQSKGEVILNESISKSEDFMQSRQDSIKELQLIYQVLQTVQNQIPLEKSFKINIEIESKIPIGAGLGSSGAYSVCLSAALYICFLRICGQTRKDLNEEIFKLQVQKFADFQEKIIHTNPSGADVAISLNGGILEFTKMCQTKIQIKKLKPGINNCGLQMILVNTNVSRNSKSTIEKVMELKNNELDKFNELMNDIGDVSKQIIDKIERKQDFQNHIEQNQKLLTELGVSSSEIDKIVEIMKNHNVIGKLTGAGGGGCVIGYSKDKNLEKLSQELIQLGFQVFQDVEISECGLVIFEYKH